MPQRNDWRKELNQATRAIASAAPTAGIEALRSVINIRLRDIGEALGLDSCTLIALNESRPDVIEAFEWSRPMMLAAGVTFNARAFKALFDRVRTERHPILLDV